MLGKSELKNTRWDDPTSFPSTLSSSCLSTRSCPSSLITPYEGKALSLPLARPFIPFFPGPFQFIQQLLVRHIYHESVPQPKQNTDQPLPRQLMALLLSGPRFSC